MKWFGAPRAAVAPAKPAPKATKRAKITDAAIARAASAGPGRYELTPLSELPRVEDPFAPYAPPKALGFEADAPTLAQDYAGGFGPTAGPYGSLAFHEGIGFPGYTYLAELAQRPEYRKGAEVLAREMTRKWIRLHSTAEDDNGEKLKLIEAEFKRLNVRDTFRRAAELDGFFGRGQIYIDTGHGDKPDELTTPLIADARKIKRGGLKRLTVVEPLWTYPQNYNSTDPLRKDFYQPQSWTVMAKTVHASRLLTFIGREVPDLLKPAYAFGGLSLSQMAKPYVDNWLRTRQSVSDLLHSFTVWGLKTDLGTTLQGGDDGDQLIKRAALFNLTRDNRGMMLVDKGAGGDDKGEEFFNVTTPLAGVAELQAQAQEQMASVFSIPLVVLLGITPTGLNASSDGEIRVFYDFIHALQELLFGHNLGTVLKLVQLSLFGEIDDKIGYEFVPLWQLDEAGQAGVRKTDAETDTAYIDAGVLSPEEVRGRIAANKDSAYSNIDVSDVPEAPEPQDGGDPFGAGEDDDTDDDDPATNPNAPQAAKPAPPAKPAAAAKPAPRNEQ